MTAAAAHPPGSHDFRNASPREVRAALIPEEAAVFDRQWRMAMALATEMLDLTPVFETLAHWQQTASLTSSLGQEKYRRMLAQVQHTMRTGEGPPGTVPWSQVKAELGL